ncbi:MAG: MoaD/ThiS family protein [Chloroflexi bacterium]|nr:MoaD/ThiS family protein [Chloroflexota bacterium]
MSIKVSLLGGMRALTGGASTLEAEGHTVAGVIDSLEAQHPGIEEHLRAPDGGLLRTVNAYVNGDDVRFARGIDTPVADGDTVSFLVALTGG